ncbi:MAG: adenylate kinase family protein [Candidatus Bathyarchaeia archaeon]|nr:adenylate kinase family protein [Candidatus Bathyarchaeia archaeon]
MSKRVILITGTPSVGKTTIAKHLSAKLDALYINLTEFTIKQGLILGEDKIRRTKIIDEEKTRIKIAENINATEKTNIIVDGHYAASVVPKLYVTRVFVLRRNPIELRELMKKHGFSDAKLRENLASEILDVCLVEALREQEKEKVCELNVTGRTAENVAREIMVILEKRKKCSAIGVDWMSMLEKKGLIGEYLQV